MKRMEIERQWQVKIVKERMNQLAHGAVQYRKPKIALSQTSIQDTVAEGTVQRAEISVKSENNVPIRGFLYSSHARVDLRQEQLIGVRGQIGLEISAAGLKAGDQIRGQVQFVYNGGEMILPYCFHVGSAAGKEMPPTMESIHEFAEFAREKPEEAVRLFASEGFFKQPFMKNMAYRVLCRGLLEGGHEDLAMEEFLVAAGEKKPVEIALLSDEEIFENPGQDTMGELQLNMSTWGYVDVTLESDSPWLIPEKTQVSGASFADNMCRIRFALDGRYLHGGRNMGRITVRTASQQLFFTVRANCGSRKEERGVIRRSDWFRLEELYLEYQDKTYEDSMVLAAMEGEVAALIKRRPDELRLYLFRIWLHMEQNQEKQAEKLLSWVKDPVTKNRADQLENYCLYLFLNAMVTRDEAAFVNMHKLIHKYYGEHGGTILALLELQVNPEYAKKPDLAINFLKDQFKKGSRSPLLYSMACRIFNREPDLLRQMDGFEIMTFSYGAKRQIISKALREKMLDLSVGDKKYLSVYYTVLVKLYERDESDRILGAICSLLIKTGSTGAAYFKWFQKGVDKDLKLTSLYEYYLYSVPEDYAQSLPQSILMYYSYENELDDKSRLLLYSNILKYHGAGSRIYESYSAQMEEFAISQLLNGTISEKLVPLYCTILHPDIVDETLAETLPDLLYAKKVTVFGSYAKRVVVKYPQLKKEFSAPVKKGTACVPIYTQNAVLLVEDGYGRRYTDTAIETEALLEDDKLLKKCRELCPQHLLMRLARAEEVQDKPIQGTEQLKQVRALLADSRLEDDYRQFLLTKVIEYCYAASDAKHLDCDGLFVELDAEKLSEEERIRVIEILIRDEYYTLAYQLVRTYGYNRIRQEYLLKMTVRMIQEKLYEKSRFLVRLCYYLFVHNQYNETTLAYLAAFYNGLTNSMYKLLAKIRKSKADSRDLAERVLAQMMFTGQYEKLDQVYEWYCEGKQVLEEMRMAYLVLKCDAYFMERERVDAERIRAVEELLRQKEWEDIPKVCCYALLTMYSRQKAMTEREKKIASALIGLLAGEGLLLSCFVQLGRQIQLPQELEGRIILEYRKEGIQRVAAEGKRYPDGVRIKREMTQVYPGVFSKTFLLFEDEWIDLKLICTGENGDTQEEEKKISGERVFTREDSRFAQLNHMIRLAKQGEWDKLEECLKEAEITDGIMEKLFPMI